MSAMRPARFHVAPANSSDQGNNEARKRSAPFGVERVDQLRGGLRAIAVLAERRALPGLTWPLR
ncbi:hypothetical protein [Burkholderia mallei]|uniref:hypothetical protein n=1 Tax=Burkholderia mallei TaxID=13373 RepID=UPI00139228E3|nr:hypothetical protein [Burkholderia mallei]